MALGAQRMFGTGGSTSGLTARMTNDLTYAFTQNVTTAFEPTGSINLVSNGTGVVSKKIGWGRNLGTGNEAKGFMYVAVPAGTYSVIMTNKGGDYMLVGNANETWDFRIGAGHGSTADNFTFTSATTNFARAVDSAGIGYVGNITVHGIVVGTATGSGTDDYEITPLLGSTNSGTWTSLGGTSPSGIMYHVVRTGSPVNISVNLNANVTIIKTA
jgi:hypothetical protein